MSSARPPSALQTFPPTRVRLMPTELPSTSSLLLMDKGDGGLLSDANGLSEEGAGGVCDKGDVPDPRRRRWFSPLSLCAPRGAETPPALMMDVCPFPPPFGRRSNSSSSSSSVSSEKGSPPKPQLIDKATAALRRISQECDFERGGRRRRRRRLGGIFILH